MSLLSHREPACAGTSRYRCGAQLRDKKKHPVVRVFKPQALVETASFMPWPYLSRAEFSVSLLTGDSVGCRAILDAVSAGTRAPDSPVVQPITYYSNETQVKSGCVCGR